METNRGIQQTIPAQPTSDGAGVKLYRSLGSHQLDSLDPFLLLDEFRSDDANDYISGFPDHPHRGFETVTYMLAGKMKHQDNQGNHGLLMPGGAQWMTAGRGIIHSEMPQQENGLMWGFQLWVNLPSDEKMKTPRYQDISPEEIPQLDLEQGSIKVISGSFQNTTGPINGVSRAPLFLDVSLKPEHELQIPITASHQGFVYCFEGSTQVQENKLPAQHLGVLTEGEILTLRASSQGTRCLVIAAKPTSEPVARYGPFVMNTRAEIEQAFQDYRNGQFTSDSPASSTES